MKLNSLFQDGAVFQRQKSIPVWGKANTTHANIIPAETGAAKAIGKVIPEIDGRLKGSAFRVPVIDGSVIDLTVLVEKSVTETDVNNAFDHAQNKTLKLTFDPVVSCDVIGQKIGALVDGLSTTVIPQEDGTTLVKVVAWYDNEMGYSAQMVRTAMYLSLKSNKQ